MKFLILITILNSFYLFNAENIRGLAPEKASLYNPNKPFTCLDGSTVIPFSQVNDDYCDCRDGSDEPGTSACINGVFSCLNIGYKVQPIPSSRVNDGICDCCDGSDEYDGKVQCENYCDVLASKMREEEEKMKHLRDQGFAKRKELIELGNEFKKNIQTRLEELESKKINAEAERVRFEERKNESENKAKEAKERQDKIFEEKQRELAKIENERKAKLLFELLDSNKNLFIEPEELLSHPELDILFDNDGSFTIEESVKLLDDNGQVDLELFVSTYYEKISPHLNAEKKEPTEGTNTDNQPPVTEENTETLEPLHEEGEHEHDENHENDPESEHDHDHDHEHDHDHHHEQPQVNNQQDNKYDEETQNLLAQSEEDRRQYEDADRELRDIERELNDVKQKLELDVGPNGEFASMIDKCFEHEDREYIYKLCPFEKTVQKSKANHGETSIGNWKGWNDNANEKYLRMKFDNGLACWNGPQRSTNVIVTCGIENKLVSVAEPNRCEYEMKFETPAVCEEFDQSGASLNQFADEHEEL